jgi:sigma-54-dependent transcriptional regulator
VRELENSLTHAVVVCTGDVIRPEHLAIGPAKPGDPESSLSTLAQLERKQVVRVLAAAGGRKARSAKILGISRPRLNRLMEKYGIGEG